MLINRISGLLLLAQMLCISGVPHRFVQVEDNQPTFLRNSVEQAPIDEGQIGKLRDGAMFGEDEDDTMFSRSAVESIPTTLVSYYQPLRSAVEHNPMDDDEDFDAADKPVSQKQEFLRIVNPKRNRKSKSFNVYSAAYVVPAPSQQHQGRPDRYRNDSPYQHLVDAATFERLQQQQNRVHDSRVKMEEASLKVIPARTSKPIVVCHSTNWPFYRQGEGKFVPENLHAEHCDYIVYNYASLDANTLELTESDPWVDIENRFFDRIVNLNKDVPVFLGIGGWTDSNGDKYTQLVSSPDKVRKFNDKAVEFLRRYGFAGLYFDWNYPACPQSNCKVGMASDKAYFTKFIEQMKSAFDPYELKVAISISGYKEIIPNAYELAKLSKYVEFMNVMSYDFHGSWEPVTGHVSPLYGDSKDKYPQYNTDYIMKALKAQGADPNKLILGIPFYGQTFMLSSTRQGQGFGSPSDGPGEPGELTSQPGMLAYSEICNRLRRTGWQKGTDPTGNSGPYATDGTQWVGFDDVSMVRKKTRYAIDQGYRGVSAWTVDLDDFQNRCCLEAFPLLKAINREMGKLTTPEPKGNDCTRPPAPVTPTPPVMVATVDTGAAGIPNQSTQFYDPSIQTTSSPWWTQPSTSRTTERTQKPTKTTRRPTTTNRPTQSTSEPEYHHEEAIIPVPVNTQPVIADTSCDDSGFMGHPESCDLYLVCVHGQLIQLSCPSGLQWNSKVNNCDWPEKAQCSIEQTSSDERPVQQDPIPDPTTKKPETTTRKQESSSRRTRPTSRKPDATRRTTTTEKVTTRAPTTTTVHLITRTTQSPTTQGPIETTTEYTEPTTTRPKWTSKRPMTRPTTTTYETTTPFVPTKKPSKKPSKKKPCINGEYYPHPSDCKKFYICNGNRRTPNNCPEGTQYSHKIRTCDHEENVKCVSRKKYLRLLEEKFLRTGIFNAALLKAAEGDPCESSDGLIEHPTKCGSYMQCDNQQMLERECGAGTHFDPVNGICGFPNGCQDELTSNDIGEGSLDEVQSPGNQPEEEYEDDEDETIEEEHVNVSEQKPVLEFDQGSYKPPSSTTTSRPPKSSTTMAPRPSTSTRPSSAGSALEIIPVPDKVHALTGPYKLVCYFTNWAWYRPGIGKYLPDDIEDNLCTHIVYGFAVLDYDALTIKPHDSWADLDNKFYERVVARKQQGAKVLVAIGGWNDSAGDKYSRLVRSASSRARFVKHIVEFLQKYGFDGLDLDWEYPGCPQVDCKKGVPGEKEGFTALVQELHTAFKPYGYLISAAVSPSKTVIDAGYEVSKLAVLFDWIAVMCYDYHGQWDKKTGHLAPLRYHPEDEVDFFNTDYTMRYWIKLGAPPQKLVMGMPLYGQAFTLADPKNHGLNAKAPGPGTAGEFTRAAGFLAYYEICDRIFNKGWTVVQDPEGRMGPYAYSGNQWVSFDDQAILRRKTNFIKELGLGGGMVWALDLDDFKNRCGHGRHPLLKVIHAGLQDPHVTGAADPLTPEDEYEYYDEDEEVEGEEPVAVVPPAVDTASDSKEPIEPHETVPAGVDIDENAVDEDYEDEDDNEVESNDNMDFKVVCYFTNWAWYRPGIGKFVPEDIDPDLCTHIVYGFAVLNRDTLVIQPHDSWADIDNNFYKRVVAFKEKGVKVTVAIGGWNDSAGDKYGRLSLSSEARARFIKKVVEFIEQWGFDGLDLDWEYPACPQVDCGKGKPEEKEGFTALVEELYAVFKPRGWLLTTAVSPSKKVIDAAYDVARISESFSFIHLMAYDFHGQWDKKTGHVAPMYNHPEDWEHTFNANFSVNYWLEKGVDPRKLILGMPMYGQSFSLAERSNTGLNSPTYGGGEAGPETRARGFLAYYEICTNIRKKNWNVVRDFKGRIGPYAYSGDQWVSFDDAPMIRHKSEFVKSLGLGGAMIWALDLDDFKNICGCEEYPLLRTINRVLRKYPGPHNQCVLETRKTIMPVSDPTTKKPVTQSTTKKTHRPDKPATESSKRPTSPRPTKPPKPDRPSKTSTTTSTTEKYEDEFPEIEEPAHDEGDGTCSEGRQFLPNKFDCNKYFVCLHGRPREHSCPSMLHWNQDKMMCDWPQNCVAVSQDTEGAGESGEEEEEYEDDEDNDIDFERPETPTSTQKPFSPRPESTRPTSERPTSTRPSSTSRRPSKKPSTKKPTTFWTSTTSVATTTRKTTKRPQEPHTPVVLTGNEEFMMVCYFTNWAWYRPGLGKFKPSDIDSNMCTHIVYGFAVLNPTTLTIRTHDSWADIDNNFYKQVVAFKEKGIKVTVAIGGWNDSLGNKYAKLVLDPEARARFIKNVIEFIQKWGFDGLDLDWEYPVCHQVDCTQGKPEEKDGFTAWVRELSEAFKPYGYLISAAVSPSKKVIDAGYDIPKLAVLFHWIAVMTYDFHGQWDKKTGHVAPLFEHPDDWETTFNANFSMNYWISKGAPKKKLVMGIPMYGQSFTLEKVNNNGLNAIAPGPGQAGEFTRAAGFLAFYEICDRVNSGGWTVVRDPEGRMGPYAYKDRQWVSYDDVEDIRRKTKFIKDLGIGGAMIWALDLDDFRNRCGCGYHPLLTTINLELGRIQTSRPRDCT